MMRWRTVVFVTLLILVLGAQVAVVAPELWLTRLWEDEAYNLTVPLNLLAGHGYTSDGILNPSGVPTPFDVRISTGPTVLLPVAAVLATGIDMVVGARLVMLVFYAALLVGLWLLGRRVAGRWGGLVAIAVPLALNTNQLPSPAQGPLDVLGEFPSAAFLVFALLFVQRRPWLGGLMLGLAIQTKFIAALALPALVLMVWFAVAGATTRSRVLRSLGMLVLAAVPSILYQLAALLSLGWSGYLQNAHSFLYFLKTGGQYGVHTSAGVKFASLLASWFVPGLLVVVVALAAVAVGLAVWRRVRRVPQAERAALVAAAGARAPGRQLLILLGAVALILVLWSGWWLVSGSTPDWVRYPAPAMLVCIPVLAAATVLGCRMLWARPRGVGSDGDGGAVGGAVAEAPRAPRYLGAAAATVMAVVLVAQIVIHVPSAYVPNLYETLNEQRAAADSIARLREPALVSPWGPQIGVIVMARSRAMPMYAPDRGNTPMVYAKFGGGTPAALDQIARTCGKPLARTYDYLVCEPSTK
jgi:Predicted membrane-bound dolichyl-phosphate-mannose-protein mannosyltransferase